MVEPRDIFIVVKTFCAWVKILNYPFNNALTKNIAKSLGQHPLTTENIETGTGTAESLKITCSFQGVFMKNLSSSSLYSKSGDFIRCITGLCTVRKLKLSERQKESYSTSWKIGRFILIYYPQICANNWRLTKAMQKICIESNSQ